MKIIASFYILFIYIIIFSCNDGSHTIKKEGSVAVKPVLPDSNLAKLKPYFVNDSHVLVVERTEIPIELIRQYYRGEDTLNEEYRGAVNPVIWFENKYGYFLLIEIACGAGGYCSTFDLLVFSKGGSFMGREYLGQNAGDLGFHEDFFFKPLSDTTLFIENTSYTTSEENDNNSSDDTNQKETVSDSVTYRVLLDTIHYKKNNWKKL